MTVFDEIFHFRYKMTRNVYAKFVARTVLVKNGQVDDAMKLLNR